MAKQAVSSSASKRVIGKKRRPRAASVKLAAQLTSATRARSSAKILGIISRSTKSNSSSFCHRTLLPSLQSVKREGKEDSTRGKKLMPSGKNVEIVQEPIAISYVFH